MIDTSLGGHQREVLKDGAHERCSGEGNPKLNVYIKFEILKHIKLNSHL